MRKNNQRRKKKKNKAVITVIKQGYGVITLLGWFLLAQFLVFKSCTSLHGEFRSLIFN